jgi:hypothetical protein
MFATPPTKQPVKAGSPIISARWNIRYGIVMARKKTLPNFQIDRFW